MNLGLLAAAAACIIRQTKGGLAVQREGLLHPNQPYKELAAI